MSGFGFDLSVTPESAKQATDEELLKAHTIAPLFAQQAAIIREELTSRRLREIGNLIETLRHATVNVGTQVSNLSASSDRLEGLTKRLNTLTWVLIALTLAAVVTPIGFEIWHLSHVPEVKIIALPPASQTLPQTPFVP